MSLKVVLTGDLYLLGLLTGNWGELLMGLFVSPHTPSDTDVIGDLTAIEATWLGYFRQGLSGWSTPAVVSSHGLTVASPVSFSNSSGSPQVIYGYFVLNQAGDTLLWEEVDPSAPVTVPDGGTYTVTQQFTDITEF